MSDLLIPLLKLPLRNNYTPGNGVIVRRAQSYDRNTVLEWIKRHFSEAWASEAEAAFGRQPICCYIAVKDDHMLGFACYDVTARGFFGPTGVSESARGLGIGKCLCLSSLYALYDSGYVYAIIGDAGPVEFYQKLFSAWLIPESEESVYTPTLKG
jgi:hypothetical protein